MKIEMIDVTEIARAMPVHVPGWQVGVSRRAWDECVGRMKADEGYRDGRLVDLLYFLWSTIPNLQTGLKGVRSLLVNGFGFWVEHFVSDLECSTQPTPPDAGRVLLAAHACINGSGAPQLVVLSLDEAERYFSHIQ